VTLQDVLAARRAPGLVVLEGFHAIKHALRFGGELLGVWTADARELESLRARLAPDVELQATEVPARELAAVVPRAQVVAVARRPRQPDPDAVLADPRPAPVVLLEDPRHLGNLGACVRVAAAAGAAGVLVTGGLDPWHPDALRGSAGLHFALPVHRLRAVRTGDRPLVALDPGGAPLRPGALPERAVLAFGTERDGLSDELRAVRTGDRPLVALDPGGAPLRPGALPERAVLAFGTERDGLSDELRARASACLALPMAPGVSSLNLATSVAAVLYRAAVG
jgi:TrmH family RNA methyltransferase